MSSTKRIVLANFPTKNENTTAKKRIRPSAGITLRTNDGRQISPTTTLNVNKVRAALIRNLKNQQQQQQQQEQNQNTSQGQGEGELMDALRYMGNESSATSTAITTATSSPVNLNTNTPENYKIDAEIPYGCLRNGKKQSYRNWTQRTKSESDMNNNTHIRFNFDDDDDNINNSITDFSVPVIKDEELDRQLRLDEVRKKVDDIKRENQEKRENDSNPNPAAIKSDDISGTYRKRTLTVGKSLKKNTVSVLLKDAATRRRVSAAKNNLEKSDIRDVKRYLRHHGLVKVGTTAPNKVLRSIYESSVLSGDIYNQDRDILINNCLGENNEN